MDIKKELDAMKKIANILDGLEDREGVLRVLDYVCLAVRVPKAGIYNPVTETKTEEIK